MSIQKYYTEANLEDELSGDLSRWAVGNAIRPLDHASMIHIPYATGAGKVATNGAYKTSLNVHADGAYATGKQQMDTLMGPLTLGAIMLGVLLYVR